MENEINTKKLLCETFYKMFKTEALPNLDMEDFIAMWQSLADKWGVIKSDQQWDEFAEEINDFKSGFVALNIDQFYDALINLNLSQISDWKNGCHNYNLSRNKSNLYFLNLGHEN